MGLTLSKIFSNIMGKKDVRILMVGLDAAGKVCADLRTQAHAYTGEDDDRMLTLFFLPCLAQ